MPRGRSETPRSGTSNVVSGFVGDAPNSPTRACTIAQTSRTVGGTCNGARYTCRNARSATDSGASGIRACRSAKYAAWIDPTPARSPFPKPTAVQPRDQATTPAASPAPARHEPHATGNQRKTRNPGPTDAARSAAQKEGTGHLTPLLRIGRLPARPPDRSTGPRNASSKYSFHMFGVSRPGSISRTAGRRRQTQRVRNLRLSSGGVRPPGRLSSTYRPNPRSRASRRP
jgi:hypothetical protein